MVRYWGAEDGRKGDAQGFGDRACERRRWIALPGLHVVEVASIDVESAGEACLAPPVGGPEGCDACSVDVHIRQTKTT